MVIQEIGEREGYTVILENSSSSVLYGVEVDRHHRRGHQGLRREALSGAVGGHA